MAFWDRFTKRWAATGVIAEPTQAQQDTGFAYLGSNPPSVEMFNSLFRNLDDKDNWLFARLNEVISASGGTPSETGATQFISALRSLFAPGLLVVAGGLNAVTNNWIVPVGITRVRVRCWGGGGGGGGSANGGGGTGGASGGFAVGVYTVTPGATIPIVGAAGGVGASATNIGGAQPGGTSSFGTFCSATGGAGGIGGNGAAASGVISPGIGLGGALNVTGGIGGYAQLYGASPGVIGPLGGGEGGAAPFGGSISHLSIGGYGNDGFFPGGGACGAGASVAGSVGNSRGGIGGAGCVIVEW